MFSTYTRHWMVGFGLGAIALVTGASAAGLVNYAHRAPAAATVTAPQFPVVSGDLGEVIVHAPGDLGEVVVHAPADLGEVLVLATRVDAPARYLAEVTVSAPRFAPSIDTGASALVAAQ